MSGAAALALAADLSLVVLSAALLLVLVRLWRGPTLADRILALDTLTTVGVGVVAAFAIRTGYPAFLDIAIALGLVGFLATLALARYLISRSTGRGGNDVR